MLVHKKMVLYIFCIYDLLVKQKQIHNHLAMYMCSRSITRSMAPDTECMY